MTTTTTTLTVRMAATVARVVWWQSDAATDFEVTAKNRTAARLVFFCSLCLSLLVVLSLVAARTIVQLHDKLHDKVNMQI